MELEIKIILLKFLLSVFTMILVSYMGGDNLMDMLLTPEEREQREDAMLILNNLKDKFPVLQSTHLTSHELLVASSLVQPLDSKKFNNIGGHDDIKNELMLHVIVPLKNPHLFYNSESMKPPSGILLSGPPGTGKTLLATSLASECDVPLLSIKSSMVEQKYFGESEKIVKAIFSFAQKIQPCIIFIDEIDSMLRNRSDFEQSSTYSIKTQFLQEIDRVENENMKIIIIAATNNPHSLDKALYRRLPRSYSIEKPDLTARMDILKQLTMNETPPVKQQDLEMIARETENFSGSDIKQLFKTSAAIRNQSFSKLVLLSGVVRSSPAPIRTTHWQKALDKMKHSLRFS